MYPTNRSNLYEPRANLSRSDAENRNWRDISPFIRALAVAFFGLPRRLCHSSGVVTRKKLQLVPGPCVLSGLSAEEEKRALALGDLALDGPAAPWEPAGTRAKIDHQLLIEEIKQEAEYIERAERAA